MSATPGDPRLPSASPSEGYVRFRTFWTLGPAPHHPRIRDLDILRTALWDRGWIGITAQGVGFGNLSLRDADAVDSFIITGTATGAARELGADGYTRVTGVDLPTNTVRCVGPVKASAETMSHAAILDANPEIQCVIHIHSRRHWEHALTADIPATSRHAEYGTPALAEAVGALTSRAGNSAGVMALAGHEDGMIGYGPNIRSAGSILIATLARILP